ncbi:MAG: HAD family phosphatase, partial [Vicinamibacteria bacterium]|jgi:HAD superfamily hydrolase (TIGR01509 family)|nr:HAD family phosphatase [Vicinamibacteria bacterium]
MKLHIPAGEFLGYIFDCDGTLVDTMPLHFRAWSQALQRAGLREELDEELFYSLGGTPTRKVAQLLAKHYGLVIDVERVFHHKEERFLEMQAEMKVIKPVVDFARALHGRAPMSVASGGPKPVVMKTLELMGLDQLFPVVVTPEDVTHGKPSPDMFLLAAQLMGVPPERCLVFEDAGPGFEAATAAGMQYVVVESRKKKQ